MMSIKDYGTRYYVTTDGRVFSRTHSVEVRNQTGSTGKIKVYPERELKGGINSFGYRQVLIDKVLECVHRVVAICFIPNPLGFKEINHIDGDKLNNSVHNLEWCSRAHNVQHSYDLKLNKGNRGESNGNSVLTKEDVIAIVSEYNLGKISQQALGDKYGVKQITISNILTGRSWCSVTGISKQCH